MAIHRTPIVVVVVVVVAMLGAGLSLSMLAAAAAGCNGILDNQPGHLVDDGGGMVEASIFDLDAVGFADAKIRFSGTCPNDCLSSCFRGLCNIAVASGELVDVALDGSYVYWSAISSDGHGVVERAPRGGVGDLPAEIYRSDKALGRISVRAGTIAIVDEPNARIVVVQTKATTPVPLFLAANPPAAVGPDVSVGADGARVFWSAFAPKDNSSGDTPFGSAYVHRGAVEEASFRLGSRGGYGLELLGEDVFMADLEQQAIFGGNVGAPKSYGFLIFQHAITRFVPKPTFISATDKTFCFSELVQNAIVCCDRPKCGDTVTPAVAQAASPITRLRLDRNVLFWVEESGETVQQCSPNAAKTLQGHTGEACAVSPLTPPIEGGVIGLGVDEKAVCFGEKKANRKIYCTGR